MANCRGCGAMIDFKKTFRGKNMPVDPDPINMRDADDGAVLIGEDGSVITVGKPVYKGIDTDQNFYISHFATCPKADNLRRS